MYFALIFYKRERTIEHEFTKENSCTSSIIIRKAFLFEFVCVFVFQKNFFFAVMSRVHDVETEHDIFFWESCVKYE